MTFGLKNAGATYQKAIQRCLYGQIRCNVEAYIDDVVVKTRSHDQFITDLAEMFENLKKFKWKLNPTKCIFGVHPGNSSASSSTTEASKPTPPRSMPSGT
jgi:hypothetical protein